MEACIAAYCVDPLIRARMDRQIMYGRIPYIICREEGATPNDRSDAVFPLKSAGLNRGDGD